MSQYFVSHRHRARQYKIAALTIDIRSGNANLTTKDVNLELAWARPACVL